MKSGEKNGKRQRAQRGASEELCVVCTELMAALAKSEREWPVYSCDARAESKCRAVAVLFKHRRVKLGLSLRKLAKRAGVSKQTVLNIETESVWPRADRLLKIADALEIGDCDYVRALFLSKRKGVPRTMDTTSARAVVFSRA